MAIGTIIRAACAVGRDTYIRRNKDGSVDLWIMSHEITPEAVFRIRSEGADGLVRLDDPEKIEVGEIYSPQSPGQVVDKGDHVFIKAGLLFRVVQPPTDLLDRTGIRTEDETTVNNSTMTIKSGVSKTVRKLDTAEPDWLTDARSAVYSPKAPDKMPLDRPGAFFFRHRGGEYDRIPRLCLVSEDMATLALLRFPLEGATTDDKVADALHGVGCTSSALATWARWLLIAMQGQAGTAIAGANVVKINDRDMVFRVTGGPKYDIGQVPTAAIELRLQPVPGLVRVVDNAMRPSKASIDIDITSTAPQIAGIAAVVGPESNPLRPKVVPEKCAGCRIIDVDPALEELLIETRVDKDDSIQKLAYRVKVGPGLILSEREDGLVTPEEAREWCGVAFNPAYLAAGVEFVRKDVWPSVASWDIVTAGTVRLFRVYDHRQLRVVIFAPLTWDD